LCYLKYKIFEKNSKEKTMKSLKKFLIAVMLVALLVSAAAVIVNATENAYTGTLTELNAKYTAYVDADAASNSTLTKKVSVLSRLYAYNKSTPVDPASVPAEGELSYTEIMAAADAAVISLGDQLIASFDTLEDTEAAWGASNNLFSLVQKCAPATETDDFIALKQKAEIGNVKAIKLAISFVTANKAGTPVTDGNAAIDAVNAIYDRIDEHPIDQSVEGADTIPAELMKANVDALIIRNNNAIAAADAEAKISAYYAITDQLKLHPVDTALYDAELKQISAGAALAARSYYKLYAEVATAHVDANNDGTCDNAKCNESVETGAGLAHTLGRYNMIRSLDYFVHNVDVSQEVVPDGEYPLSKLIADGIKLTADEMEARRIALDEQASFDDYDLTGLNIDIGFDSDADGLAKNWGPHNKTADCYEEYPQDIYGNTYLNLHYGAVPSHLYINPNWDQNMKCDLVVEWDLIVDSTFYTTYFQTRDPLPGTRIRNAVQLLSSNRDGTIVVKNFVERPDSGVEKAEVKGAVVPNVWERYTMIYDNDKRVGKLYINYVFVCDLEFHPEWGFSDFRVGVSTSGQNVGYDNLRFFQGSAYRDYYKFEKMTVRERFEYYVDYMLNEDNKNLSRASAYQKAKELLSNYAEDDEYVVKFNEYDYDENIKKPAMGENLQIITEKVDELVKGKVTSDNLSKKELDIREIEDFISENSMLINKADSSVGGYQDQMSRVNAVRSNVLLIKNVSEFVDAVSKFHRATSLAAMMKHAATANEIFIKAGYDDPANVDFVRNDSKVGAFEAVLNGIVMPEDPMPEIEEGKEPTEAEKKIIAAWEKFWSEREITLFEYYESFAELMHKREYRENAKRIINCMDLITDLEGYEDTEEFWSANEEYIAGYANIVRTLLNNGNYDSTVEGLDEAIAEFHVINVYFYKVLQQEHIAVLKEELAKYEANESYIIKEGICLYVEQYVAENDLAIYSEIMTKDVSDAVAEEIAELELIMVAYEVYKNELTSQKQDYEIVLAQNTQYFINTIAHMETVITYAELKPLFDLATKYYYGIDVNTAEAQAAAQRYAEYRDILGALEVNGEMFIGYVKNAKNAGKYAGIQKQDALFEALVNASYYLELTDAGVEGVADAIEYYEQALAEYNAEADIVNTEVSEAARVTCAARTNTISATILAIVGKLMAY